MADWKIQIAGNGKHHIGNDCDANEIARRVTEALVSSGHVILNSQFLFDGDGREDLLNNPPNLVRTKDGKLVELPEGQTVSREVTFGKGTSREKQLILTKPLTEDDALKGISSEGSTAKSDEILIQGLKDMSVSVGVGEVTSAEETRNRRNYKQEDDAQAQIEQENDEIEQEGIEMEAEDEEAELNGENHSERFTNEHQPR